MSQSNRCCNSYYGKKKIDIILNVIEKSEIELSPKQIQRKTGFKASTIRVYLRRLLKQGKIVQPYTGHYCSKTIHGMVFVPLRVHNLVVQVDAPWLDVSDDVVVWVGDVKVRVQFGLKRKRITGRISCDGGMDKNSVLFALDKFYDVVWLKCGRRVERVVVKTFEVNRDFFGIRLDGVKCYTRRGLHDLIMRIYQKEEDVVRGEYKISKSMTVDEFASLIQGGISSYNLNQFNFMLLKKVESLIEGLKFTNVVLSDVVKVQKALLDRLNRLDNI